MGIKDKLSAIQQKLKAPKNLYNSFGKYSYRNAEGILEAYKPFEAEYKVTLVISDSALVVGNRIYIQATARLYDQESDDYIEATALAREAETKKGMDESQITGTASSYARKYALNGLFLLDDTKDADTDENRIERENRSVKDGKKDVKDMHIDEVKANALRKKCESVGVDVCALLKKYSVESLTDLTEYQAAVINKQVDKVKDGKNGKV